MARTNRATNQATDIQPANVKGAQRNHPRLRVAAVPRPMALYEIVHGALVMPDPNHEPKDGEPARLAHYFASEVVQLEGTDVDMLIQKGIIVPLGEQPTLYHTMPDRDQSYNDQYKSENGKIVKNDNPEPEGTAKLVRLDIEQATERMYGADSLSSRSGGLNGSGR